MCLCLPHEENKTKIEQKPPLGITGMKDGQQETLFPVMGNAVVMSTGCCWQFHMAWWMELGLVWKPAGPHQPNPYGKRWKLEEDFFCTQMWVALENLSYQWPKFAVGWILWATNTLNPSTWFALEDSKRFQGKPFPFKGDLFLLHNTKPTSCSAQSEIRSGSKKKEVNELEELSVPEALGMFLHSLGVSPHLMQMKKSHWETMWTPWITSESAVCQVGATSSLTSASDRGLKIPMGSFAQK